jgi:RNA polymerase sigma-70 factor (ECF subfamily)
MSADRRNNRRTRGVSGHKDAVTALRARDEQAFRVIFERDYPVMKRVARSYVDSDAVAEEVVQEAWMAILRGIDGFEGRSTLRTWMFAILTNEAKSHNARERRELPIASLIAGQASELAMPADRFQHDGEAWPGHWAIPLRPWQEPERRLLSLEAREHLRRALRQLPERQRLLVGLRDIEGFSAEEVCGLMELSADNQRVLLHRARLRLRAALGGYLGAGDVPRPRRRDHGPSQHRLWSLDGALDDEIVCRELVELVTDFLERALPERGLGHVEQHLVMCEGCRTFVRQIELTRDGLAALRSAVERERR